MTIIPTLIADCFIVEPKVFKDKRGYFSETFNLNTFNKATGFDVNFVQDNESFSSKGVLRGLHYQIGKFAQAKLVRVIKGTVLDVAVDIRKGSNTFGKYVSVELSETNKRQLFVPRGFAHGFIVLSDTAIFSYKCDNFYDKASERGLIYNDPNINIDWKLTDSALIISEKDLILPQLENVDLC